VIEVLLEAGASLSTVDDQVIKPSVQVIQSNIKPFKRQMLLEAGASLSTVNQILNPSSDE
jgi:hypothetical protein